MIFLKKWGVRTTINMFWLSLIIPILSIIAAFFKGYYLLLPLLYVILIHPVHILINLTLKKELSFLKIRSKLLVTLSSFLTVLVLWSSLFNLDYLHGWGIFYLILNCAISGGTFTFVAAHELIHRREKFKNILGMINLFCVSYPQFKLAHLYIHHKYVATEKDPASARFNENIYAFVIRSAVMGTILSFKLDGWKIKNRMIKYSLILTMVYLSIYYLFGTTGLLFYIAQSLFSIFLLEGINYVEHYGLVREGSDGSYEPFQTKHTWDSNENATNYHLFNLGYHSDHHMNPKKDYYDLDIQENAHQMPYGYSNMLFLAMIPWLWFKKMNKLVIRQKSRD